jgi:hypothetical protein
MKYVSVAFTTDGRMSFVRMTFGQLTVDTVMTASRGRQVPCGNVTVVQMSFGQVVFDQKTSPLILMHDLNKKDKLK